jgi:hypothetical protein
MKPLNRCSYWASSLVILALAGTLSAQDRANTAAADPKMQEMMKKAEIAGTPGSAHKTLEPLVGNWTTDVKCWMTPGGAPTTTKGTSKSSWAMNGRFVQEEFSGEFMGKPFKGMSLTGYDNTKGKYNNVWVDDMHTSMFTSEGTAENEGKVITLVGKMDCPMTGEKDVAMKQVLRIVSNDKHIFEMHDPRQSPNTKVMEITYTRSNLAGVPSQARQ